MKAGADIITTSSYQASIPGFIEKGFSESESVDLLLLSTRLALDVKIKTNIQYITCSWRQEMNSGNKYNPTTWKNQRLLDPLAAMGPICTTDQSTEETIIYLCLNSKIFMLGDYKPLESTKSSSYTYIKSTVQV
jgi:hypothetical protein